MGKNFLKLGVMAILFIVLLFSSCNLWDAALVGTWEGDYLTITFGSNGDLTIEGLWADLVMVLALGSKLKYTAADGAGEWWFSGLVVDNSDNPTAFTYTITGDTLETNIFYEEANNTYLYTRQ